MSRVDDDIKRCSRYLVDVQDTYPYTCTYPGKVEKQINFLTVELKIFSTGVEYM